jgi:hypothetical protein
MKVTYDPKKVTSVSQLEKRKNVKYHMAVHLMEQAVIHLPFAMYNYYGKLSKVERIHGQFERIVSLFLPSNGCNHAGWIYPYLGCVFQLPPLIPTAHISGLQNPVSRIDGRNSGHEILVLV